jgi:hypothetical protein
MAPMPEETTTLQPSNETSTMVKPDYSRQHSLKRHNSDNDEKVCKFFLAITTQIRT